MLDLVRNNLRLKLVLVFMAVAILPVIIVGIASYRIGKAGLLEESFDMLATIREMQGRTLVDFLHDQVGTAKFLADFDSVEIALRDPDHSKKDEPVSSSGASKPIQESGADVSLKRLEDIMSDFEKYYEHDGYHDVLLVRPDGQVIFSVKKLSDLGTNLRSGSLKDSGLGRIWDRVIKTQKHAIGDYSNYQPAGGPASFVAVPVFEHQSKAVCGVLVLRMGSERVNEIMRLPEVAGKTAETYLVGSDRTMRSQSRFEKESTVLKTKVDTNSVKLSLEDKVGHQIDKNNRGVPVLSAYGDARLSEEKDLGTDFEWALLGEVEVAEVEVHTDTMAWTILGIGLAISLAVAVLAFCLASSLSKPIKVLSEVATSIGKRDLSVSVPDLKRGDELGNLSQAFGLMVDNLKGQIRRILEGVNILSSASAEVAATVAQVATSSAQTSSALAEVTTTVEEVKQSSRLASDKAKSVSQGAQESVQVAEIGKRYTASTVEKMNLIKDQMESIGDTVVRLSEHSQQIGTIIASVQDIADQSNLLAVNASIEAARAGDQGKGFAVVAQEIKSLADQSKQATEQVRSILEDTKKWVSAVVMATEQGSKAVQSGLEESVQSGEVIGKLSGAVVSSSQAASVIQSSSEQQFMGVEQVSTAMVSIEQAMRQIKDSTEQLATAAQRLGDLGRELKDSVEDYNL